MILDDFFCRIGAFLISDYAVVNVIPCTSPTLCMLIMPFFCVRNL